ncbi:MAG: helix-turn-helix domain-containing protein [Syntrophomonadaceae bacterium]
MSGWQCYNFAIDVHKVVLKECVQMDFIRIQDKIISMQKIDLTIRKILQLRARGLSQQEVADRLGVDRTFISRLEGIGELRKGRSIACIGFPISNKQEIQSILGEEGVDFIFLMTEAERLAYVDERTGREMLGELMDIIARLHDYEKTIFIGSDQRIKMVQSMLDSDVIGIEIGISPITEDKWVDPKAIRKILRAIKSGR